MTGEFPTKEEFRTQLNSLFSANVGDSRKADLELTAVESIVSNERQENFTLLFRAPDGLELKQDIYDVTNTELGKMSIFLVPVEKTADGVYLEAVFNHLL